jgi:hypothetical protein
MAVLLMTIRRNMVLCVIFIFLYQTNFRIRDYEKLSVIFFFPREHFFLLLQL